MQSPSKNENVLKSVTIDGTVCKRVNRCDRVTDSRYLAMNRRHNFICVYLRLCQQGGLGTRGQRGFGKFLPKPQSVIPNCLIAKLEIFLYTNI